MPVDLSAYRDLYVKTGVELVHDYDVALQGLIQPNKARGEIYSELRRITHSLKGQSFAMNYNTMGKVWYRLEQLFTHCINNGAEIEDTIFTRLPQSSELMTHIHTLDDEKTELRLEEILSELELILMDLGITVSEI